MWAHGPKGRTPVDLEWSQAAYGWALSAGAAAKALREVGSSPEPALAGAISTVVADLPRLHREQVIVDAVTLAMGNSATGLLGVRQFVQMFLAAHDALERYDPGNPLGAPERGEEDR